MFGIGALEFFLIAVVALLVIGPKDLPRALYHLGRVMRKLRSFTADIQSGFDEVTQDVALEDIAKEANKAGDALTDFRVEQQTALEERERKASKPKRKKKNLQSKPKTKTKIKKRVKKKTPAKKKTASAFPKKSPAKKRVTKK